MAKCEHPEFRATADIHRLTDDAGKVTGYTSEFRVFCVPCGRQFQFLGLPAGMDNQGAAVSVDHLTARLAICPQGEVPSTLDRVAIRYVPPVDQRH